MKILILDVLEACYVPDSCGGLYPSYPEVQDGNLLLERFVYAEYSHKGY